MIKGRIVVALLPKLGFEKHPEETRLWQFFDYDVDSEFPVLSLWEPLPNGDFSITYRSITGSGKAKNTKNIVWLKVKEFRELYNYIGLAKEILINHKKAA